MNSIGSPYQLAILGPIPEGFQTRGFNKEKQPVGFAENFPRISGDALPVRYSRPGYGIFATT